MAYIAKKTTVDGVKPIGSSLFGLCSTASGTAQKVVQFADFDVLVSGVTIHVYFTHENTADNPTLQVGSTSAIGIRRNGVAVGRWSDNSVVSFTYNGTYWIQNDADEGGTTYTMSVNGHTLTLTPAVGTPQSVTLPDDDTTYGLSIQDHTISLVAGGTNLSVTVPDADSMPHKTVDATSLDNTAGNFTFSGSGAPWEGTDWVGFQIGDGVDKFQVARSGGNGTNLIFRFNDHGGTDSANWSEWYTIQNKITAGTGLSFSGDTLNHSNSVTALTTASLRKVRYDAQGHITGSSAVTKSDIIDLGVHDIYFKTHSVGNINIAAGAYKNVSMAGLVDGYTLAGIVAISKTGSNNGYVVISAFYYNSPANDIFVHLVNTNSSAVTIGLNVRAIYYK